MTPDDARALDIMSRNARRVVAVRVVAKPIVLTYEYGRARIRTIILIMGTYEY